MTESKYATVREVYDELTEIRGDMTAHAEATEKRFGRLEKWMFGLALLALVPKLAGTSAPTVLSHVATTVLHHV